MLSGTLPNCTPTRNSLTLPLTSSSPPSPGPGDNLGDGGATASDGPVRSRWASDALWALAWYIGSRAAVLATMEVVALAKQDPFRAVVMSWDSVWYIRAARHGWPSSLPIHHGYYGPSTVAFFPLFPLLIRFVASLFGLPLVWAGFVLSNLSGLGATLAVTRLIRHYAGSAQARRAAVAFCLFPATFIFSLIYAEGMMISLIALSLLAMLQRRWLAAGLLAGLATATRPDALMLVLSGTWAAWVAIRRDRHWHALVAPALAPVGFVAYQAWLWHHTGMARAWFYTERGGWRSYLAPMFPLHVLERFAVAPFQNPNNTAVVVGLVIALGTVVVLLRHRPPMELLVYALGVITLAVLTRPLGARPRFILDAFPLVTVLGQISSGRKFYWLAATSGVLLVGLTAVSVATVAVVP